MQLHQRLRGRQRAAQRHAGSRAGRASGQANPPQPGHARQGSDVTAAVPSRGARACLPGVWLSDSPALRGCASCSAGLQALHCCRCLAGLDLALSAHARSRCLLPVHLYRDVARQLRSARPSYTESLRRFRSACLSPQLLTLPGMLAVSATQLLQLGPFPLLISSRAACAWSLGVRVCRLPSQGLPTLAVPLTLVQHWACKTRRRPAAPERSMKRSLAGVLTHT